MLRVADLQQMVNGFVQPMRSAGASQKVLDDFSRMVDGLEPFKETTLADFNEFLATAQQAVQTGAWPAPGKRSSRRGEPKAPKMTVEEASQRLAALAERAAADSNLDYAAIEAEVMVLAPMSVGELKDAAEQIHIVARGRTKTDLLKNIAKALGERKSPAERTPRPAEMPNGSSEPATAHAHERSHAHAEPASMPNG